MATLEDTIGRLKDFRDRDYIKEGITMFDDKPSVRKQLMSDAIKLLEDYKARKKPYESHKKLPCICGKKRVETWWGHDSVGIICPECRRSVTADSEIGAIRAWNKAVQECTK